MTHYDEQDGMSKQYILCSSTKRHSLENICIQTDKLENLSVTLVYVTRLDVKWLSNTEYIRKELNTIS